MREIAWGSLPTIRITKDGHDERQRRAEEGREGKKFNYKHRGGRRGVPVLRERTRMRTMTRRRGRLRRSRPNGHGLAPGKTLSAKRRESVQRLSLGFKKLLITWISSPSRRVNSPVRSCRRGRALRPLLYRDIF